MTSYALDELPWPEAARALERDRRLILPVGALEQHGPHLPLGANTRIAGGVARAVSERLGILRAPPFSYGTTVGGGAFAGAAGLGRKTLHRAVNELFAHWEDDGVSEFVIVTAHRYEPHLEALLMALTDRSVNSVYDLYGIDVSDIVDSDPESEHGGELETSLLLHLAPELVRIDHMRDSALEGRALRRYMRRRVPTPPPGTAGAVGHPERATAAKGELIFRRYVEALCSALGAGPGPEEASGAGSRRAADGPPGPPARDGGEPPPGAGAGANPHRRV